MTTEYKFDYFNPDLVKSKLEITNAVINISGTYACWCEYNHSIVYGNEMFRSNISSVFLNVIPGKHIIDVSVVIYTPSITGSHHSDPPVIMIILIILIVVFVIGFFVCVLIITFVCCCYCKRKGKQVDDGSTTEDETTPLIHGNI